MLRRAAGARPRGGLLRRPVPRLRADGREHVIIAAYWDDLRFAILSLFVTKQFFIDEDCFAIFEVFSVGPGNVFADAL